MRTWIAVARCTSWPLGEVTMTWRVRSLAAVVGRWNPHGLGGRVEMHRDAVASGEAEPVGDEVHDGGHRIVRPGLSRVMGMTVPGPVRVMELWSTENLPSWADKAALAASMALWRTLGSPMTSARATATLSASATADWVSAPVEGVDLTNEGSPHPS